MTFVLRIDPDGTITPCEGQELTVQAHAELGNGAEVWTCHAPDLPKGVYCLFVDEWGISKGLPLNVKAWALYGGGPLVGIAYLVPDWPDGGTRPEIPAELVAKLTQTVDEWLDPQVIDRMREIAAQEGIDWNEPVA